jgi:hypothetical protein
MENREPREGLMRRKIWAKRKRGQLRKKNEKQLGFNVFYFSLFYSKSPSNWSLWVFFFSKNLGSFFTVDFSYLLGVSSNCLTCLKVEPALQTRDN